MIALLNPVFSASGSTELFRLGVRAVYLESLCYGAVMGALFIASASWLRAAASLLSFDKVMALFGNAAPVIALMVSMTMRLIPRFLRRGDAVLAAQRAVAVPGRTRGELVRERLRLSSVLMGWGMEDCSRRPYGHAGRGWGRRPPAHHVLAASLHPGRRLGAGGLAGGRRGRGPLKPGRPRRSIRSFP